MSSQDPSGRYFCCTRRYKPLPLYAPGLHAIWAWFALCACAKPLAKILATPLGAYVLVITPLGGMLLVYRPETRGRVAPEGGGSINRNIPTRGVIISL